MEQLRVFISYRRADTQHVAGRLGDRIGTRFRLFMDIDDIPLGSDFATAVQQAVDESDVLLVLIGPEFLAVDAEGHRRLDAVGDWVATEVSAGLSGGMTVIPVLVDGAEMPAEASLPESVRPLVRRQAFRLTHASFNDDVNKLMRALAAIKPRPAEGRTTGAQPDGPVRQLATPTVSWLALAVVVGVIVVEQRLLTVSDVIRVPQVVLALLPGVGAAVLVSKEMQRLLPAAGRRLQSSCLIGTGVGITMLLLSLAFKSTIDTNVADTGQLAVVAFLALPFGAALVTYVVLRVRTGLLALWPALFVVVVPLGMSSIVGMALT